MPRISRRTLLGSGIAVALVGGGFAAWRMGLFDGTGPAGNSIAVLPFANLSGDPWQSYFSDGLAAEVRAELARNDLLQVVAQVSSNRFAELRSADRRRVRGAERDRRLGDGCAVCADQEAVRGCTRGPKRPVGAVEYAARQYAESIPPIERALELNSRMGGARAAIGASQMMLGQVAEANQSFAAEHNSLFGLPGIAIVARKQGRNAEAEAALARLVAEHGDNGLYQQAHLAL